MNPVQRTKGLEKVVRIIFFGNPGPKYVVAGDSACRRMVREVRAGRQYGPSDKEILASAEYDLAWEIMNGFWEIRTA